jgi:hypothetical protein
MSEGADSAKTGEAADGEQAVAEAPTEGAAGTAPQDATRKRRKAHEVAKDKVQKCAADLAKLEADLEVLQTEGLLSKKSRDKATALDKKINQLRQSLVGLQEDYKGKAAKATAEEEAAKRRKLIEEEKVESSRVLSDAATLIMRR